MICPEIKVALQSFTGTFVTLSIVCIINHYFKLTCSVISSLLFIVLFTITVYCLLRFIYNKYLLGFGCRAAFLAIVFTLGIYIHVIGAPNIKIFGTYMVVMSLFHYTEFLAIATVQPRQISTDTFVINHSPQYTIAAITSWTEFFIETYFFPGMKQIHWLSYAGLCICILGDVLRKTAILTAGPNFNHLVQCEKSKDHILVTHGVYGWFRHPSYVGWFYWSIGTQIILINPICVPAYAVASWMFFKGRIYIEEIMLLNFFGQEYCDYQIKVGTGIPFIEGYKV